MVLMYKSTVVDPPAVIYMGVDKNENEHLIRWGWPEDVWFHVDKVSSAHVYLRLEPMQTIDDIPQVLIDDCAQLVKANSIQGNKMSNVDVVYTMWENLKKTGDMAIGQIGFKDEKKVKTVRVAKRVNEIVNRLNKTEENREIDYRAAREERDTRERQKTRTYQREQREAAAAEEKRKAAERALRSYDGMMCEESMRSNRDGGNDSDEFMEVENQSHGTVGEMR